MASTSGYNKQQFSKQQSGNLAACVQLPELELPAPLEEDLPWSPGKFGILAGDIYRMSVYPSISLSVISSIGLVAGIIGRKFNVEGLGLNFYATLLMDSGFGKKQITDAINAALLDEDEHSNGNLYKGKGRFTGPKSIFKMLTKGMSRICVMTEAGLVMASSSGDQKGTLRAMLDLYGQSGPNDWTNGEGYSDDDESIPVLKSPALSVISESTPHLFLREMAKRDAKLSGELARPLTWRIAGDRQYKNRNRQADYSPSTRQAINELLTLCMDRQTAMGIGQTIGLAPPERSNDDSDKYNDIYNAERKAGRTLEAALALLTSLDVL